MPLSNYGVVIGTLDHFERDSQDNFGKYFHGHVYLNTPTGIWEAAVDVSVPATQKIQYRVGTKLKKSLFANVSSRPNGFYLLASNPTSGALDYPRSPFLGMNVRVRVPLLQARFLQNTSASILARLFSYTAFAYNKWIESTGNNALDAMETVVTGAKRVYIFGVQFNNNGHGVHDVHMNQGDPPGSQWFGANGIWQDGGIIVERPNGALRAFLTRFSNQSLNTDNAGNPK
ncbi:MAG: hypothetical protein QOH93_499 [Chloroflexia bacterium]|jgi:hypothetical protein|nr:hypothetical protein [Chloroflexia bacterium]